MNLDPAILYPEIKFQASRSSGAGGQHVNKVNTRVELRFNIPGSMVLTEEQKSILMEKLANRVTRDGELIIVSEKTRSQYRNKENCVERFNAIIESAFVREKPRISTKPSYTSRMRRVDTKKLHSAKKQNRKKPDL
jgi:ribosome-associated protein